MNNGGETKHPTKIAFSNFAFDEKSMAQSTSSNLPETCESSRQGIDEYAEAPAFFYDMAFDMRELKASMQSKTMLADSGYRSAVTSTMGLTSGRPPPIGTGWMVAESLSDGEGDTDSIDDAWDGHMTIGQHRIKIKDMSDILASRYAFVSGAKTDDGLTIVTFPDCRTDLSLDYYQLLINYLIHIPAREENHCEFIIIIDRRNDKWSSVRTVLLQIGTHFPGPIRVVFVLKPEGVLQRALEVGYRTIAQQCPFKIILCESSLELRHHIRAEQLSMDVGGLIKYNHLEWVQHRMNVERMMSSATVIAQSLNDFGRILKETELPNDSETTARLLEIQTAERDAIKFGEEEVVDQKTQARKLIKCEISEDFRISIRKGLFLLRSVRQLEKKPTSEQLSPTRLHNVTAIERMLVQLEETERSFDVFWESHERRLLHCLQLRQFEDSFRKLQASFARHMMYLEEHREVGNEAERAQFLVAQHEAYAATAQEEIEESRALRVTGMDLVAGDDTEGAGSLLPKCAELERMADALSGALERRRDVLELSKRMHSQIAQANAWCKKGVEVLSSVPIELFPESISSHLEQIDTLLREASLLELDSLSQSPTMNKLILLTTTETSTLLAQVAERIDDIRRMSVARRHVLLKIIEKENPTRPVQIVSPEKSSRSFVNGAVDEKEDDALRGETSSIDEATSIVTLEPQRRQSLSREMLVINELVNTEQSYVGELESLVEHYMDPFSAIEHQLQIALPIRGRPDLVFGNLRELLRFHSSFLLHLKAVTNSTSAICKSFLQNRSSFLNLYISYCQNKSSSEEIRKEFADSTPFFLECQRRAGHPLPLGAYLLKPVQRITKYQLLLKELERNCDVEVKADVEAAVGAMLDLLNRINAAIQQLHIIGFVGDLRLMGPLRLQSECEVFAFNKKKPARRTARAQRRHLFLFDGGLVLCKKRGPQLSLVAPEYYEYKNCIMTGSLNFSNESNGSTSRFEVWDETKSDGWAIEILDSLIRSRWIEYLSTLIAPREEQMQGRPRSWTSTLSTESINSSKSSEYLNPTLDDNGNGSEGHRINNLSTNQNEMKTIDLPIISENHSPSTDVFQSKLTTNIEESDFPEETVDC